MKIKLKLSDKTKGELKGIQGINGEKGEKGDVGSKGLDGKKGDKGDKGDQSKDGKQGKQGIKGEKGERGFKGDKGNDGKDGEDGQDGQDGSSDTSIEIRDKLQLLIGEKRLDASAVKGLSTYITGIESKRTDLTPYLKSATALTTYLSLTGGTLTGDLTLSSAAPKLSLTNGGGAILKLEWGATGIIGTETDNNLSLVSNNITRLTLDTTGGLTVAAMTTAGFIKNSAVGLLSGGNSIDISADTNLSATTPIVLTGDALSHADTAVTPGTYPKVTVDQKGHITAGSTSITMSEMSDLPTIASGVYTPTLTNVTNLDSSATHPCKYIRIGSIVTVTGMIDVDPTTTGVVCQIAITLPIASNLGSYEDLQGVATNYTPTETGMFYGDITNDRADLYFLANSTANHSISFTFTYKII